MNPESVNRIFVFPFVTQEKYDALLGDVLVTVRESQEQEEKTAAALVHRQHTMNKQARHMRKNTSVEMSPSNWENWETGRIYSKFYIKHQHVCCHGQARE